MAMLFKARRRNVRDVYHDLSELWSFGYVHSPFCKLRERFGRPMCGRCNSIDVLWEVEFSPEVFANVNFADPMQVIVANWKNGPAYNREGSVRDVRQWRVYGPIFDALHAVGQALDQPVREWSPSVEPPPTGISDDDIIPF